MAERTISAALRQGQQTDWKVECSCMEKIQTIYYRGFIKSCNYRCSYCAFAKGSGNREEMRREENGLRRFYEQIRRQAEAVQIFFLPYGEGMIYPMYQAILADLSALPQVRAVGIQTNLSWKPESFLRLLRQRGNAGKIRLWATYHPEMTSRAGFLDRIKQLADEVEIAAGMVATLENEDEIRALRAELPPPIYLWLNAMDRRKAAFSREIIERLQAIDPMFGYEFARYRQEASGGAGFCRCLVAENQYLDRGMVRPGCFFQKSEKRKNQLCHNHRLCDCYLGYSNFAGNPLARFFGANRAFRIPQKRQWQAIFLDFDGVLTENGRLLAGLPELLATLSAGCRLYLATARSVSSVRRALGRAYRFFSGGVFFDGACVIDRETGLEMTWPIAPAEKEQILRFLTEKEQVKKMPVGAKQGLEEVEISQEADAEVWADKQFIDDLIENNLTTEEKRIVSRTEQMPMLEENWLSMAGRIKPQFFKGELLRLQMPTTLAGQLGQTPLRRREYGSRTYFQAVSASKGGGIERIMARSGWSREDVLIMTDNPQDKELLQSFPYTAVPLHQPKLASQAYYALNAGQLPLVAGGDLTKMREKISRN